MRTRFYRCYACLNEKGRFGRNFEVQLQDDAPQVKLTDNSRGAAVRCPNCKLSNLDPQLGGNVVAVHLIHFEPPRTKALFGRAGRGTLACLPDQKSTGTPDVISSGDVTAVTCPNCKQTAEYAEYAGGGIHPGFDIPLQAAADGKTPAVPELHKYQKPTDPTKPPAAPLDPL